METMVLFAQRPRRGGPFGGPGSSGDVPPELMMILLGAVCVGVVIGLAIAIFFLLTLSRCLAKISARNRQMEPGMVWLNLIPCFGIVWLFITVIRLGDSLVAEFADRRIRMDGDGGKTLGIAYGILAILANIPYIGLLFGIPGLICFILYWVKIAGYSGELDKAGRGDHDDRDRDRDRDYDDRDRDRDDYRRGEDRYR